MIAVFRRGYGAGPLHLLVTIASLALAAYAFARVFDGAQAFNVVVWFLGAIVVHDLVAFPLYTGLDRMAARLARGRPGVPSRVPVVNYVRVPALLAGLSLLVYFPLILGSSEERYESQTTLSQDVYLERWLLLSGALFVLSAAAYAVRSARARRGPSGH